MNHGRSGKFFLLIFLLVVLVVVPAVSAGSAHDNGTGIRINITSTQEGEIFYIDVVPAWVPVRGTIDPVDGIRNLSVTNDGDAGVCENDSEPHGEFLCKVISHSGTNHLVITVRDKTGNSVSALRNYTEYAGPPPPKDFGVTSLVSLPGLIGIGIVVILVWLIVGFIKHRK